jgi:hypothetical protein
MNGLEITGEVHEYDQGIKCPKQAGNLHMQDPPLQVEQWY